MSNEKIITEKLNREFSPVHFELLNESHRHSNHFHGAGAGDSHFTLVLVSRLFEGLSRVQRQQLIHKTLAGEFAGTLHALSMRLMSPKEWEDQRSK